MYIGIKSNNLLFMHESLEDVLFSIDVIIKRDVENNTNRIFVNDIQDTVSYSTELSHQEIVADLKRNAGRLCALDGIILFKAEKI